jgi:C4-dicarboxylate transporter DctM subunit
MFGMLTGSNIATIMAVNSFMKDPMEKMGWDREYIAALMAAAGPMGYMIPPNNNAIMYAVIASCSVSKLFLAALLPGVLWGVLMMIVNRFTYKKYFHPEKAEVEYKEMAMSEGGLIPGETNLQYFGGIGKSLVKTIPALIMPLIIFGGIYGGVFTATEAGAVSGLYAILLGFLLKRSMRVRDLIAAFNDTGRQVGVILFITPMAAIFTRVLVLNNVPNTIATFMIGLSSNHTVLLLMVDLIFIVAGFFLNTTVLIFVITPLLLPTANALGLDPIQMGVMMFVAVGLGSITPPMAMNLFIASKAVGVDTTKVIPPLFRYFFFAGLPMMLLVTFWPGLSLWLPSLIG